MIVNTIGIDIQSAFSCLMLREGSGRPQAVGDGSRSWFPSVVSPHAWGTQALSDVAVEQAWNRFVTESGQPVATPDHSAVWKGAYDRLFSYLGFTEPSLANGYLPVATSMAIGSVASQTDFEIMIRQAGLVDVEVIPATYALLFRYLTDPLLTLDLQSGQVVVGVVGEDQVILTAFRVEAGIDLYQVAYVGQPVVLPQLGYRSWLCALYPHLINPDVELPVLSWVDAVFSFVGRYSQLGPVSKQTWNRSGTNRLYYPNLSWQADELWEQIGVPQERWLDLTRAIADAADTIGHRPTDAVVLGGPGAAFPIVTRLRPDAPTWTSRQPTLDLASGALWWPVFDQTSPILRAALTTFSVTQRSIVDSISNTQNIFSDIPSQPDRELDTWR